jgi:hypothetical protein
MVAYSKMHVKQAVKFKAHLYKTKKILTQMKIIVKITVNPINRAEKGSTLKIIIRKSKPFNNFHRKSLSIKVHTNYTSIPQIN